MNRVLKGVGLSAVVVLLFLAAQAQALMLELEPGDADKTDDSNSNLNGSQIADIFNTGSVLELLYKANFGGSEEGSFYSSYSAIFGQFESSNPDDDPSSATLTYDSGDKISCPECYLVVKDGNEPQYLFNLADWDGMETIEMKNFYVGTGAISNFAIWGKTMTQVPEPGSLVLLGLGLLSLGLIRRRYSA